MSSSTLSPDEVVVEFPDKLVPTMSIPRGGVRYRGAHGGRGSGKSVSFAVLALLFGYAEVLRILCTRELQISIRESFYAELVAAINKYPFLQNHYTVLDKGIFGSNGTEFIFRGLRHNIQSIKSMAQVDICIVEEAEDVPEHSWRDLTPTVRAELSEIWALWNPRTKNSPVDRRLRQRTPKRASIVEVNWQDNPFFGKALEEERLDALELYDPATYAHVWEGAYLVNSQRQILNGKIRVAEFTPAANSPQWEGPYYGMDFGFAQDPTTAVKCWVYGRALYIEFEAWAVGLDLDDTGRFVATRVPGIDEHEVKADSARPESISYLKKIDPHAERVTIPRIRGVKKWPGSVADGIAHLRSYSEIVVHPRCKSTIEESRLYCYKVDKHTDEILPDPVDAHNHCWDAVRYALERRIKAPKKKARVL